ncbi:unnamed protein product [Meloidogyne enterolobii]|uniref:Uncharacterized protein n=1 Tax=Meloidogyne enterolobii TaxID=390850 RepID=A0ACB0ZW15_MELEN
MHQYFQRIQNRNQLSPDARPLKRHNRKSDSFRQSGGSDKSSGVVAIMHPDVFPQQEKQEEDNLGPDRVVKGYQIEVIHSVLVRHEYESLMKVCCLFDIFD